MVLCTSHSSAWGDVVDDAPITFHPYDKLESDYECHDEQSIVRLCFEKSGFEKRETTLLGRAVLQIIGALVLDPKPLEACSSPLKPQFQKALNQLTDFFRIAPSSDASRNTDLGSRLPLVVFSRFRKDLPKSSVYANDLTFAFSGFVEAVHLSTKPYLSVGINRSFSAQDAILGSNTPLWASILTLAFMKNMALLENDAIWNSPSHHLAQCLMYRGNIPPSHALVTFKEEL